MRQEMPCFVEKSKADQDSWRRGKKVGGLSEITVESWAEARSYRALDYIRLQILWTVW